MNGDSGRTRRRGVEGEMARGQQMESGVEGGRKVEVGRRMDQVDDTRKDEGDEMEEGMEEINYIKTRKSGRNM